MYAAVGRTDGMFRVACYLANSLDLPPLSFMAVPERAPTYGRHADLTAGYACMIEWAGSTPKATSLCPISAKKCRMAMFELT
jgi:hypothetical protein